MAERVDSVKIHKISDVTRTLEEDLVVVEEPLEIRLGYGIEAQREQVSLSVTMRTPGDDEHLSLGFLYGEGIISSSSQIASVNYCNNTVEEDGGENIMRVEILPEIEFKPENFTRNFYTTSSCGVCGKASIEHIRKNCSVIKNDGLFVSSAIISKLPETLESVQSVFKHTGGLHACGVFNIKGELLLHKEDVGRHNALDKLIGSLLISNKIPLSNNVLLLSGRISFELVQKAVRAGIPIIAAVGAPSSLSLSLAKEYGVTLIGFVKNSGFNIYCGIERIID